MFSKLALRNVTRSLKDYSVYFLTLTFGVSIFYVFNSLESHQKRVIRTRKRPSTWLVACSY